MNVYLLSNFVENIGCQKIQFASSDRVYEYFEENPDQLYALENYIADYSGTIRIGTERL